MSDSKKQSLKWGQGGIIGGGTKFDQIKVSKDFTICPENGLNRHKSNIKTDKPYDSHINGKK